MSSEALSLYKAQRVTLGVSADDCRVLMDEWLYRGAPCDLQVRRAKTKGMFCVQADIKPAEDTSGLLFISWCLKAAKDVKVDIKPL